MAKNIGKNKLKKKEKSDATPWKSPTGDYNVPVGQENFEFNGRNIQASYMDINGDGEVDEVIVIDVGRGIELDGMTRTKYKAEEFRQKFGESQQSKQFGL